MTYSALYRSAVKMLSDSGNESAASEARCMFEELIGTDRIKLIENGLCEVPSVQERLILDAVNKRAEGYPLQYIIGKWSFMGSEFFVGEGVLIPRDDTEVAVMTCYEAVKKIPSPEIIELCSGSGIIAVTLDKLLSGAEITAIELKDEAFAFLQKNLSFHGCNGVKAQQADVFTAHTGFEDGYYDAIVSNPPYISRGVLPSLQKEVQFEPYSALDGGTDGLDFYRCIAAYWTKKLKSGGTITLEIGEEQAEDVSLLLSANGFSGIKVIKDIQGLDRVIFGTKI